MISNSKKYRRSKIGCYKYRIRAYCRKAKKADPDVLQNDTDLISSFPDVFKKWEAEDYDRNFTPVVVVQDGRYQFKAARDVHRSNSSKAVKATDRLLDEVRYFDSIASAAKLLGAKPSNISACLHGRQKTVKGYEFEFV
jgi:hypothetical protein